MADSSKTLNAFLRDQYSLAGGLFLRNRRLGDPRVAGSHRSLATIRVANFSAELDRLRKCDVERCRYHGALVPPFGMERAA
jgi:hypothetical protein